jgi:hypothetical protein
MSATVCLSTAVVTRSTLVGNAGHDLVQDASAVLRTSGNNALTVAVRYFWRAAFGESNPITAVAVPGSTRS